MSGRRIAAGLLAVAVLAAGSATGGPSAAATCDKTWAAPGTDGVWDQAGVADGTEVQWSPPGVPQATDAVCLPGSGYTVTVGPGDNADHAAASLAVGEGTTGPRLVLTGAVGLTVAGAVTVAGQVAVGGPAALTAGSVTQVAGQVEVYGTVASPDYVLAGGLLAGNGVGSAAPGRLTGDLQVTGGVLDPGVPPASSSIGYLNVGGDLTIGPGGAFHVDYDGGTGPEPVDHVHVSGAATLGGTLDADLTRVPAPGSGADEVLFGTTGLGGAFATTRGIPAGWVHVVPFGSGPAAALRLVPAALFSDVGADHPFLLDIAHLVSIGVAEGVGDGTFRPGGVVTRGSMAAFLYRLAGEPAFVPPSPPTFDDVGPGHVFRTPIEWLASTGVTEGVGDGTFRPGGVVTRGSMAAFLYRLAGEPAFVPPSPPTFGDVGPGHVFRTPIEWLASTGVTTGYEDGTFRPSAAVSRQSMSAFLRRFDRAGLGV